MVHLKYPSMERQDLTQGQLGSFKFTPVDEVPHNSPYVHPLLLSRYAHLSHDSDPGGQCTIRSRTATDPSFFNHQIRPALHQSRLRLGPAAVRAAVESASPSPQKQRSQSIVQDHMRGSAQSFYPHYLTSSEQDSLPSFSMNDMQGSEMGTAPTDSIYGINPSILRALQNEQDAHQSTRSLLEQETSLREKAEAKIKSLQAHNQGLLNSIKLLQSTVKHMVKKENRIDSTDHTALEQAVHDFNKEVKNTKLDNSILYDVLAQNAKLEESLENEKNTISALKLDLLDCSNPDDHSNKAAKPQQALRTPMGIDRNETLIKSSEGNQHKIHPSAHGSNGVSSPSDPPETLEISHQLEGDDQIDLISDKNSEATTKTINRSKSKRAPPMLELPTTFLDKYSKRPVKTAHFEFDDSSPEPAAGGGDIATEQKQYRNLEKKSQLSCSPFIDWKIDNRHTNELRGSEGGFISSDSNFKRYPVRYVPKVSATNIYRTVMIDYIPIGAKYSDILAHVRGGTLESIQMYGPVGKATKFVTARVVFTHEIGATTLYQHGQDPGIKLEGHPLRVWQVLEPTYPKNAELKKAIYEENYTRILLVNAPHLGRVEGLLKQKLKHQVETGFILKIDTSFEGLPMVECTSVEEAMKGLNLLMRDAEFGGACFDFEDDYCAARYT